MTAPLSRPGPTPTPAPGGAPGPGTALLIGPAEALRQLERQLDLLQNGPVISGWIVTGGDTPPGPAPSHAPVLGTLQDLEAVIARRRPAVALVCMPAVMHQLVTRVRTRLRRLGVPDRFMPTLEDQLDGRGPRALLDVDLAGLLDRPRRAIDEDAVRAVIAGRRILVTGAGGSIGSEIARIVARYAPEHLVLMDRSESALFEIDRQIARHLPDLPRRAVLHDIVDAPGTLAHCRALAPEVVFHAAAHKHVPMMEDHPGAAVDNNLFGTRSIADAASEVGVERFVMISTDKAVNPTSVMGATKRLAELYVQDLHRRSATAFSMVRFGNVLGSSGSVLDTWSRQIADGGPLTVTDPEMTRFFMTIPEAAALVIQSAAYVRPDAPAGQVFILDMGEPIGIMDLARRFIAQHGLTAVDRAQPGDVGVMPIVVTGARPGEKRHEMLALAAERLRPTPHPEIHALVTDTPPAVTVREILAALDPARRTSDPARLAATIRSLVPEAAHPAAA